MDTSTLQILNALECTSFTKKELKEARILKYIRCLRYATSNSYLLSRIRELNRKWRKTLKAEDIKPKKPAVDTVFDAIINGDRYFFETKNIPDLLQRLLNSFDKNYNVSII